MEKYKLFDAELKFMNIIWEEEPIKSGELVRVCNEKLGWKKSTTYTVLRKLAQRGVLKNENTIVTSIVKKEETQIYESHEVVEKSFGGSFLYRKLTGRTKSIILIVHKEENKEETK